jgi:Ca-activated chloride channel homolog
MRRRRGPSRVRKSARIGLFRLVRGMRQRRKFHFTSTPDSVNFTERLHACRAARRRNLENGEPKDLSPKNPRRQETSHAPRVDVSVRAKGGARALSVGAPPSRSRALRLLLPLCLLLASPLAPRRAAAQSSQATPRQSAPAPNVRPRTVGTKGETARPAMQPERPAAQPERTPAQTNNAGQANKTSAQDANGTASQDSEAVGEDEVVRVNSNLVIIPASVVDSHGHAVTDLKVEDFELRVDGEVKQIGDLSRAETPVQVALLFDNSASLSSAREFEKQAAVRFFRSVVRPIDRAAVYSISTTSTLSQPLTADVSRLVRTIQNFGKPDGATALFDAVAQAADYMRPLQGRKVLVIVSDGTDTVSDVSFEDAVNKALRAECQVYVVQTQQVEDPNLHDTVSEQRMSKLTEQTGGAVYVPQSVEDLDAVFTQISLDISQQYLLGYYPQDERHDNFFRFISVRIKTRPALRVRARKGFYPASARNSSAPDELAGGISTVPQNSSRPEYVASDAARPANISAAQRRSSGGNLAKRDNNSGRKIGPDGPDDDDRPKPTPSASDDTAPTFTLTTVAASSSAPSPAPTTSEPSAMSGSTNLFSAANPAAPATNIPTSATNSPSASPSSTPQPLNASATLKAAAEATPQPRPTSTLADSHAATNASEQKPATSVQKASASEQKASASEQKAEARPRTPTSSGVLNGKAISLPRPVYPASARNAGASGKVVVEVTINEEGKVVEAHAVSGHPMLQQAAVQAARLAKFSPAMLSGQPVKVTGTISYTFVWQ